MPLQNVACANFARGKIPWTKPELHVWQFECYAVEIHHLCPQERSNKKESAIPLSFGYRRVKPDMWHIQQRRTMTKRLTSARHVLFKHGDTYDTAWEKVSSSRRGEAGLQLKIRIFSTYSPLVFRKHNEMLQEVIRNYKIIAYLNKWNTESYIKLQQLQHFSSEKWMRAKNEDFTIYIVNDYHFMLFGAYDRLPICM